jgi:hypothetical protein
VVGESRAIVGLALDPNRRTGTGERLRCDESQVGARLTGLVRGRGAQPFTAIRQAPFAFDASSNAICAHTRYVPAWTFPIVAAFEYAGPCATGTRVVLVA